MFEGYEKRLFRWDKEQWYEEFRVSCCWREVWNGNSRCIWHAEVDDKPIQDLLAAQSDELFPMAIDGLYLRNIESSFPDWGRLGGLSFRSCRMIGADFSEAYLKDTDFSEAVLYGSNLSEANLEDADFRGASFNVQISDENSGIPLTWVSSDFSRASLNGADLSYAVLTYVNLADTFANEVDFSNADLEMANLSDADLRGSDFTDAFLVDADLSNAVLQDVDFKGAGIQDATFAGVRMNRETSIGKPNWSLYRDEPEEQDALARAYHRLGEAALENGLIGEARRLRIWERKARRKEARQAVIGKQWPGHFFPNT